MDRDEYLARVTTNIETHGWHAQAVFGTETNPPWLYTVGRSERGERDLTIFGLDARTAHAVVSDVLAHRRALGRAFTDGERVRLSPEAPFEIAIRDVRTVHHDAYFGIGLERELVTGRPLRLQMIVVPDPHGRFPWDDGVDPAYAAQPRLWEDTGLQA